MMSAEELNNKERLERARAHVFSLGIGDGGGKLFSANVAYGMATIHGALTELGLKDNATFVSTPDENPLFRQSDWDWGLGYGGKVKWGDGDTDLIFLNWKANTCGKLVGALEEIPNLDQVQQRVQNLIEYPLQIRVPAGPTIGLKWDLDQGDHFINVFRVHEVGDKKHGFPPYVAVIHCDNPEMKGANPLGLGLYYDKGNPVLDQLVETIDTPFGRAHFLSGNNARQYFDFYFTAEAFAKERRRRVFEEVFGAEQVILNETHQGFCSMNEVVLGAYSYDENRPEAIYPITISETEPSYLVNGRPNLSPEVAEATGLLARARTLDVEDRVLRANVLPHGAGYDFPTVRDVISVEENAPERTYVLDTVDGARSIKNAQDVSYVYRGRDVMLRSIELGLVKPLAVLELIWTYNARVRDTYGFTCVPQPSRIENALMEVSNFKEGARNE